jgi:hypothetical protein
MRTTTNKHIRQQHVVYCAKPAPPGRKNMHFYNEIIKCHYFNFDIEKQIKKKNMVLTLKDHIYHYIILTTPKTIIFAVYEMGKEYICSIWLGTSASATNRQAAWVKGYRSKAKDYDVLGGGRHFFSLCCIA